MKFSTLLISATLLTCACNSKPKAPEPVTIEPVSTVAKETLATAKAKSEVKAKTTDDTTPEAGITSPGTLSSESNNTAKARKGWSKTAKGALIGGVVGAGTGAVVNKKNRAVGAVVGGAVGAGAGAIIGNEMDKKDGRH